MDWKEYRKAGTTRMVSVQEFRDSEGEIPDHVSISEADKREGAPRPDDMIAQNPEDPDDMWLVSQEYFEENYVEA